ncbi:hypothetical protein NST74_12255 [Paenibacillus sp. FSL F4-0125]|uniref:hypothetical protein n=1 Tax=Paenibacillus sp. FSL F4-0125 TaxID=2954730 RepID=UPI0030F8069A
MGGEALCYSIAAVIVTLIRNFVAGLLAGRSAGLSPHASPFIGLSIVSHSYFSITMANLDKAGGLPAILPLFELCMYFLLSSAPF